ncbi:MAG: PAS domain S-box protein, partial [bacterium]
ALMTLEPPQWKFTSGNKTMISLFNIESEEELKKLGPGDLSPEYQPDGTLSSQKAEKTIKKAMKTGSHLFEWIHKTVDGKQFPATVLLSYTEIEKGKPFLQATVRDITEKKKMESLQERLQSAVTHAGELFEITDSDGGVLFVNPAFEKITGYPKEEVLGKHARILKSGEQLAEHYMVISPFIQNREKVLLSK